LELERLFLEVTAALDGVEVGRREEGRGGGEVVEEETIVDFVEEIKDFDIRR
jgi:hypothetical protein